MPACNRSLATATFLSILCTLPATAQQPTSGPTRAASCLIRVRFQAPIAPLDCDALQYLANSNGVFEAALSGVASRPVARNQYSYARFECTAERRIEEVSEIEGKLFVYLGESDAAVNEDVLLAAVVANLRLNLGNLRDDELRRHTARREVVAKRLADCAARRDALRNEQAHLLAEAGAPVSPVELEKSLISLQDKRRELQLTLVGQQARQEAISKAISELSARVAERSATDPVVRELHQVVEIRERILERTRARAAATVGSNEEVDRAIENVTLARAELAKACASAALNAGGDQIAKLNGDLTQLSIDTAEIRARSELLTRQTEELRSGSAMKNAVQYDRLTLQLRDLERAMDDVLQQVSLLDQQAARFEAPSVTVIGH